MRRMLTVLGLGLLVACGSPRAAGQGDDLPSDKVFVCKFVGKPGVDERLQTGQNPISVSINALEGPPVIGQFFEDRQGRSVVIAFDTGQPEPSPDECPQPPGPTTTTTAAPTTTGATTSTTSSTTTTSTTEPPSTSTSTTSTTAPPTTSTSSTTTQPPGVPTLFAFGAAATVCVAEVPTIRIEFQNTFPELAGQTGTLTMSDINGNVVSTQPLVYQPGTTVDLLYPGTAVNPDGSIDDVPGWILTDDGFWIRDPSDEFLREGINLSYTVNPTATAFVTYPPESSTCANPDGPFPPGVTPTTVPGAPTPFAPTPTVPTSPAAPVTTPISGLPITL